MIASLCPVGVLDHAFVPRFSYTFPSRFFDYGCSYICAAQKIAEAYNTLMIDFTNLLLLSWDTPANQLLLFTETPHLFAIQDAPIFPHFLQWTKVFSLFFLKHWLISSRSLPSRMTIEVLARAGLRSAANRHMEWQVIWRPSFGTKDVLQLEVVDKNDGFRVDDGKNYSAIKTYPKSKIQDFCTLINFIRVFLWTSFSKNPCLGVEIGSFKIPGIDC